MTRIDVFREGKIRFPFRNIRKKDILHDAIKIVEVLKISEKSVAVVIVDDEIIRKINRRYRKKDKPTDVISFAERDVPFPQAGGIEHLGDVYISLDSAWRQYPEYSQSFREEIRRLLVHGVLHLLGYDHEKSKAEEMKMRKKEEWVMKKIADR